MNFWYKNVTFLRERDNGKRGVRWRRRYDFAVLATPLGCVTAWCWTLSISIEWRQKTSNQRLRWNRDVAPLAS